MPPDLVKSYSCKQNKKVSALAVPKLKKNKIKEKKHSRRADISCLTSLAFSILLPCTYYKNFNPCQTFFELQCEMVKSHLKVS